MGMGSGPGADAGGYISISARLIIDSTVSPSAATATKVLCFLSVSTQSLSEDRTERHSLFVRR